MKRYFPLLLLLLSGCVLVNVNLVQGTKKYEEKILEGTGKPKILILDLSGVLALKEESEGGMFKASEPPKISNFVEALKKAEKDEEIVGVIVRINSPGGSVTASDILYHEIKRFKEKRKNVPVYAFITELGASGGYYVACAADQIFINPTGVTGSIGVISMKFNIEGLMSKIGVQDEIYKSGDKKDFWSPFRPTTPEEKAMIEGVIKNLYGRFLDAIYAGRSKVLSMEEIKVQADGRIFTADEALRVKFVDGVGYLDEAIEGMKKALGIKEARVIMYHRPGSYKSNIYSEFPGMNLLSLLSVPAQGLDSLGGIRFMYLWNP